MVPWTFAFDASVPVSLEDVRTRRSSANTSLRLDENAAARLMVVRAVFKLKLDPLLPGLAATALRQGLSGDLSRDILSTATSRKQSLVRDAVVVELPNAASAIFVTAW